MTTRIGLLGDYDEKITAHRAIGLTLPNAAQALQVEIRFDCA